MVSNVCCFDSLFYLFIADRGKCVCLSYALTLQGRSLVTHDRKQVGHTQAAVKVEGTKAWRRTVDIVEPKVSEIGMQRKNQPWKGIHSQ